MRKKWLSNFHLLVTWIILMNQIMIQNTSLIFNKALYSKRMANRCETYWCHLWGLSAESEENGAGITVFPDDIPEDCE